MVKQSLATAIGIIIPAVSAYLVFHITGAAPTPSPVDVRPVPVESAAPPSGADASTLVPVEPAP